MKSFEGATKEGATNPIIALYTLVRGLFGMLLVPILTIYTSLIVIYHGMFKRDDRITFHMWLWSRLVLTYFGVRVLAEGFENIPKKGGGILVFNHQSHFDIPAITGSSRRLIRYGAKIELFKIPFFGPAIRVAGCLPIARDNRKEVFRIYEEAAKKFEQGICYALAPEGTRQPTPEIANFKKGPFIFAVNAGVPVIPVVVEGADRVMPKGSLIPNLGRLHRTVRVRVLPPVYARPELAQALEPDANATPVSSSASAASPVVMDILNRTREIMLGAYADLQAAAR